MKSRQSKEESERLKEEKRLAKEESKAQKVAARESEIADTAARKARQQQEKADLIERELKEFGSCVINEVFAGKRVRIYSNGYVRVSGVMIGTNDALFERLLGINASADVAKKTGLGRAAVAIPTMGANLLFSPNKRGDMYLTISTDVTTHMLHMDPPTEREMKAMHKLATAGQSVLDALGDLRIKSESMHEDSKSNEPSIDLGDQIQKLVSLHDAGALTDSEFESAKANVIGAITKEPVQNPPSNETFPELQSERELDVILLSAPRSQIEIIKVVREYSNWKLAHAKSLVDNPPSIVATGLNALLAEELKRRLESFGAQVELR